MQEPGDGKDKIDSTLASSGIPITPGNISRSQPGQDSTSPSLMLKFEKRQILKNVGSSWSALAVNVMVGIFLSPFILHHLGDAAFGIWVLIFSVTGYYGLFDLSIRSSIVRYVSQYTATDDQANLTQVVNT